MNLEDISTQLLFTTVPIWTRVKDGGESFGTGFIYSVPVSQEEGKNVPMLVTNAHVVKGAERAIVEFVEREGDMPKLGSRLKVEIDGETVTSHIDVENDLAIVPIGGVLNSLNGYGKAVFFRSVSPNYIGSDEIISELPAMEEITFIGYPSGLYDEHNVTPLIRRGTTATPPWNDFQGKPQFLVDAGVFPGSSGSPVFILNQGTYAVKDGLAIGNRLIFLGVLSEAILREESENERVFLGVGKVIKAVKLKEYSDRVLKEVLGE